MLLLLLGWSAGWFRCCCAATLSRILRELYLFSLRDVPNLSFLEQATTNLTIL